MTESQTSDPAASFAVGPKPNYPIESVDSALKLLLLFETQPAIRLTEAALHLGVAPSTAHRLLAMLQYRGFVSHDGSKHYHPGPTLTSVAFAVLRRSDLRQRMRQTLEALNDELGETVHLGVLEGRTIRFIDAIESPRSVRVAARVGRAMPAHCTSTGKALLARLSRADLHRLYPDQHLEQLTKRSLKSRDDLEKQLEQVRKVGLAFNREESEEGVTSLSIALPLAETDPSAALNVSVPTSRMSLKLSNTIGRALKRAVLLMS